jgi:hypothetical protein
METENSQVELQKFSDAQVILQYIFGGKSTFTLQSVASGERFTYKISESAKRAGDNRPSVFFVSVLTGPDNSDNFSFVGTIFERKTFKFSPKAGYRVDSPSVKAFSWAFSNFVGNVVPDKLEFWPSSHCARCGRKLTVPTSVHNGFGPECITKVGAAAAGQAPIVGSQQPLYESVSDADHRSQAVVAGAVRKTDGYKVGHVVDNGSADAETRRMVNALRNFAPENFTMDGEMTQQEAEKFWFKRYKKQPLTAAQLAEMEAR